ISVFRLGRFFFVSDLLGCGVKPERAGQETRGDDHQTGRRQTAIGHPLDEMALFDGHVVRSLESAQGLHLPPAIIAGQGQKHGHQSEQKEYFGFQGKRLLSKSMNYLTRCNQTVSTLATCSKVASEHLSGVSLN